MENPYDSGTGPVKDADWSAYAAEPAPAPIRKSAAAKAEAQADAHRRYIEDYAMIDGMYSRAQQYASYVRNELLNIARDRCDMTLTNIEETDWSDLDGKE